MEKKGVNILEDELKKYNGKDAIISISHKLYGEQKIKCKLDYIFDECRVGFKSKDGQEIFVYRNNLVFSIKDDIYFADDIMEIRIKLYEQ